MKLYLDHLSSLPESLALKAVTNLAADYPGRADEPCESLAHAILTGFIWDQTPEGCSHWAGVHRAALAGEFDSATPTAAVHTPSNTH